MLIETEICATECTIPECPCPVPLFADDAYLSACAVEELCHRTDCHLLHDSMARNWRMPLCF